MIARKAMPAWFYDCRRRRLNRWLVARPTSWQGDVTWPMWRSNG